MKRKWHSPEPINKESREADAMPPVGSTIDQIGTNREEKNRFHLTRVRNLGYLVRGHLILFVNQIPHDQDEYPLNLSD